MGSDRMHRLENIYIKHGLTATAAANQTTIAAGKNSQLPPRTLSTVPRADSVTDETAAVFRRHGKNQDTAMYKNSGPSGTARGRINRKRSQGPRLHKQNFVEDGQNIIANGFAQNSKISGGILGASDTSGMMRLSRDDLNRPSMP